MSNVWGRNIKLSIFGESHGPAVGLVFGGLEAGMVIDRDRIRFEMARRAPGRDDISTPRAESDGWEVLSGVLDGRTTGAPLCVVIRNENVRSGDYTPHLLRPGHADLTALIKYGEHADHRGGGHFSGRLTAPLVFAGAIAKQVLERRGIKIGARIAQIYDVIDAPIDTDEIFAISRKPFPVADDAAGERMRQAILAAKADGDSLGGVIECAAAGVPAGWGDPFFDSLESAMSSLIFSIPAVKGIEFGDGFGLASMRGSEANDPLFMREAVAPGETYAERAAKVGVTTNRNGGINGGISNGNPITLRVAIKPTPTIGREQTTVDLERGETVTARFGGRHDPCIVPRAVPVVEAALALCLLDHATACSERS